MRCCGTVVATKRGGGDDWLGSCGLLLAALIANAARCASRGGSDGGDSAAAVVAVHKEGRLQPTASALKCPKLCGEAVRAKQ